MKLFLLILLFPCLVFSKTIKIAVIDSGLDDMHNIKLCPNGLKDFTKTNLMSEFSSHGNNISHLIADGLSNEKYCLYHLKAMTELKPNGMYSIVDAFKFAIDAKVDIINYSAAGLVFSQSERDVIKAALDAGIIVVNAVGNNAKNLDKSCDIYPACYNLGKLIVVGNTGGNSTNYGRIVKVWINGNNKTAGGVTASGSSQSTALETRKLVEKLLKENK